MHRVIYKDPATVSKLAQSFRDDVQVDIGNIKQALSEEDSVEWSPDDLQIYIRKAQQIENDLRSGKEGSITAVNEFFKWSYQVFNAGWGGNIDFDDVFPSFSSTMASYLGKSYYPDEINDMFLDKIPEDGSEYVDNKYLIVKGNVVVPKTQKVIKELVI